MLSFRQLLTICIALYAFNAASQRGKIITTAATSVMDPNGDGYVSLDNTGFSNDGYYVDEFEIPMFALPVFGDGDTLNDAQAGGNCGVTDLTVDSTGAAAYAALDDNDNLIFRLRLAQERSSVQAYTILIDTDGKLGAEDPNSTGVNAGFEIDITLIKNQGVYVYDIDGIDSCPTEVLSYDVDDYSQVSIADIVSCGDKDYFIDFYLPFGDLTTEFGITEDSELQFIVVTNISGTCAMAGKISDIGGVDDTEYDGCITCAFEDLASNQCPVPFSSLSSGGGGFLSGATPTPTMETPLKEGDAVIQGTAGPTAELTLEIFDLNENLISTETAIADADSIWVINLGAPLVQGDSVTAVAQIAGSCDSGVTGSQLSFAVVVLNTAPVLAGTGGTLNYTENDGAVPVDPGVIASDNEDLDFVYATIQISNGYEAAEDVLNFTDQLGLTGSYDVGSATLTITGDATVDDYNTAIQSVTYSNSSENPVESTRTVTFIINDGTVDSNPITRDILVSSVNDSPVLSGTSGSTEYTTETPPFVVNSTFSITDVDNSQITSAEVFVVQSSNNTFVVGDELSFTNTTEITGSYNSTTGVLSLSGSSSLANYAAALNSIEFEYNPPGTANESTRRITFNVSDGTNNSNFINHFITFATSTNFPPEVIEVNGEPVVGAVDLTTNEDSSVEVCLTVNDPDGDLVTVTITTPPTNGTAGTINEVDGEFCFNYAPNADFNGTETIVLQACDALGECNTANVTINIDISPVNDPPVIAPSTVSADEKTTTELCINPADITDIEGDTHEFTSGTSANGGTVVDGTADDLCFDYTPPTGFIGTDQVEVTICDSNDPAVCSTTTVDVEVVSVNENPIIYVNGIDSETMTVETFEDSVKVFCFSVIDVDGDNVSTISINNISGNGTLIEDATEFCYQYTPVPDENGIPSVWEITIQDDGTGNLTDMITVTLNLAAVNDFPTLNAITDPTAINEDAVEQTINLSGITAGGGESQTLTVTAVSDNVGLIPNPTPTYTSPSTTGSLAYTPVSDQSGTAVITVTVDDGVDSLNTVTQTFTVTVNAVNDQPALADISDPAAIDEDATEQTVNIAGITAGGGESQTLTVTATSDNTSLIPNPTVTYSSADATGSLAYTPVSDQSGTAVITVTVNDGQAANNTVSKTFTVIVNAANDQPTLADITDPTAINEDATEQTVNLSGISAGGGESQTLTVTAVSDNTGLIPNPTVTYSSADATGSLAYTPVADQSGTASITVTVDDGQATNNTVSKTFTITVNAVNDQPTLADITDPTAINEDATEQTVNLSGISAGGGESQTLAVTATSSNTSLIPNPTVTYSSADATGSLAYTPVADQSGTATITVTVNDGQAANNTVSKTFTVTVNAVNDQPTLADITDPTAIDEDATEQTINLSGISAGGGESQTLTVTATSSNSALIPDPSVTYTSAEATGSLAYTPVANQFGTVTITVTVNDGQAANNTVSKTFTVTVNPVNDQPTLADITDPATIDEDATEQTVNLSGISAGGGESQTLTVTAVSDNTGLIPNPTVTYSSADATGSLAYTPVSDQSGTATITVTVNDGQAADNTVSKTFTVTVNAVNDQPTLDDITIKVDEKVTSQVCVSITDVENDTHQFISATSITAGAVILNGVDGDLCFDYTPPEDFVGMDEVEVTICDVDDPSVCATGTINVEVLDVNDAPIFTENGVEVNSITIDALEDTPLDLCLEYTDPEGNHVFTIGLTNLSGGGTLEEGTTSLCYTYIPEENMHGPVVWQVDVQDDGTPPATATIFIDINVANVNDSPETQPDTLVVMRKESKSMNVLLNDFDLDGDDLQLSTTLEKQPIGGIATVSQNGTITYVSDANFRGIDSLIYIVKDLGSPSLTAFGKMIIRVDDNPFTIYQTISPNGDGMNDYWHIEGIDFYPNNSVSLFDRYNNLVFEINGYNNEDKVWTGKSNTGSNNTLPEGTYFYRITAGEAGTFGGFVVLRGIQN